MIYNLTRPFRYDIMKKIVMFLKRLGIRLSSCFNNKKPHISIAYRDINALITVLRQNGDYYEKMVQ